MSFKKGVLATIVSACVFGYGHYLATDNFLKWYCVLLFAGSFLIVLFNVED
jgi:hypothetical protein